MAGRASICGRVIAAPIQGRMPRERAGAPVRGERRGSAPIRHMGAVCLRIGRWKCLLPEGVRRGRCAAGQRVAFMGARRGDEVQRLFATWGPFAVGRTCRTGAYRESMTIDAPIAEYLRPHRRPGRTASACRLVRSVCPRMERRISRSISWIPLASVEYKKKSTAIRDYGEPCGGEAGI